MGNNIQSSDILQKHLDWPQVILASSSPFRQALLNRLNIPFICQSPNIDETPKDNETILELTQRLAKEKATAIHAKDSAVIIGSDQMALSGQNLLGKPKDPAHALRQLLSMRHKPVVFYTAVHVWNTLDNLHFSEMDITTVYFRNFSDLEAQNYLETEQPFQCAGSFKSEGLGICLFEKIENEDPTALIGLPMIKLCQLLRDAGINPLSVS